MNSSSESFLNGTKKIELRIVDKKKLLLQLINYINMYLLFNFKERDSIVAFLCSIFKTATEIYFFFNY